MRESPVNAFEHTTVPHGDDNQLVRGVIAHCGHCGAAVSTPFNSMQASRGNDDEVAWRLIARKLEAKSWHIGKSRGSHRCPKCQNAAKFAAINRAKAKNLEAANGANMEAKPMTNGVHPPQHKPAERSTTMSRDDRRIIFEKLRETYVDEKVGYSEGWTDEKVATHLGVPRAWVRVIRDENFGDEISNEDIRKKVAEASAALVQIRAVEPEMRRLLGLADKIERTLAEIQKVFK